MSNDHATHDEGTSAERGPRPDASGPATESPELDPRSDSPAQLASGPLLADVEEAGLTDEEVAIYRRRVAEGFYNSREVAAEVARRMLRRHDV